MVIHLLLKLLLLYVLLHCLILLLMVRAITWVLHLLMVVPDVLILLHVLLAMLRFLIMLLEVHVLLFLLGLHVIALLEVVLVWPHSVHWSHWEGSVVKKVDYFFLGEKQFNHSFSFLLSQFRVVLLFWAWIHSKNSSSRCNIFADLLVPLFLRLLFPLSFDLVDRFFQVML